MLSIYNLILIFFSLFIFFLFFFSPSSLIREGNASKYNLELF